MMFLPQENKCKVLEIVLHDLERNQCKMMALICFRMLTGVTMRNMKMQPPKPMLMLTQGAQKSNAEEEEERKVLVPTK
jgi:hypothetical protein